MEAERGSWQHMDVYIFAHSPMQSSAGINAHRRKLVDVNAQSSRSLQELQKRGPAAGRVPRTDAPCSPTNLHALQGWVEGPGT